MPSQFTYHDPAIKDLLVLSSYLYLLSVFEWIAQYVLSAGLLGQILLGIIYGSPLAEWLDVQWQETFVVVGYVGLLLIVFEGGMTTSLPTLTALLPLSTGIAVTGLLVPIGFSFLLTPMFGFPLLHSFAAGAALSSTSLGTVLALISSSGLSLDLQQTKLGTALLGAAVMDDAVAFVLSEIINLLGESDNSASSTLGAHIGRTIGVTFGLGIVAMPVTRWIIRPLYLKYTRSIYRQKAGQSGMLLMMAIVFIGMTAGARYAGTSPLYGVYVGGLVISYLMQTEAAVHSDMIQQDVGDVSIDTAERISASREIQGRPLPSGRLRRVHTHPTPVPMDRLSSRPEDTPPPRTPEKYETRPTFLSTFEHYISPVLIYLLLPLFFGSIGYSIPFIPLWRGKVIWKGIIYTMFMLFGKALTGIWILFWPIEGKRKVSWGQTMKLRLPAALLLGFAMIARGEIGLLISQIAYTTTEQQLTEEEFLITTWAIVLCTILGPVGVGYVIKKFKVDVVRGGWH
ncbi:hypothetical protein QFC22_005273 [Naganishia vaughanmartiniae]|uniref:Uncharacterized protein n=1 Tax=Naganishia vaughanmartiniae TaxID=1424756 RepID=A0ACC2WWK4_9TREE|nr:hypothetical protein QFC22_005273 [Naganishia vaughanmartiniae]